MFSLAWERGVIAQKRSFLTCSDEGRSPCPRAVLSHSGSCRHCLLFLVMRGLALPLARDEASTEGCTLSTHAQSLNIPSPRNRADPDCPFQGKAFKRISTESRQPSRCLPCRAEGLAPGPPLPRDAGQTGRIVVFSGFEMLVFSFLVDRERYILLRRARFRYELVNL